MSSEAEMRAEISALVKALAERDAELVIFRHDAAVRAGARPHPLVGPPLDVQDLLRHAIELTMMLSAGFIDTGEPATLVTLARQPPLRQRAGRIILNQMLCELAYGTESTEDHMVDAIEQLMMLASED